MSNDNSNPFERLFKLWAMVGKLILDGKRYPDEVADTLQKIVDENPDLITVNRSIPPILSKWAKEWFHQELQSTGPTEFDASKLNIWLHPKQKNGVVKGSDIHNYLQMDNRLDSCLGLRDLEEIQKKGIVFFRKHFKDKVVFGWKSVVRHRGGNLGAPSLCEIGGEVCLGWYWLDLDWSANSPALRLAS